jgi:prephenate dehydrogenase
MSIQVLFIGLEEMGASIAMAFGQGGVEAERLGFDPSQKVAKEAQKAGAVDRLISRPASVAHDIDLAIVSLINREAEEYIGSIAPSMKEGSLILDAAPNKTAAVDWASRGIPPRVHYLNIAPVVGPEVLEREVQARGVAGADRYKEGLLAIVAQPDTHEKAIDTAVGLAEVIGASPLFIEAAEYDSIRTTADTLPTLLAIALQRMVRNAPSWREIGRLAGGDYADVTALCERLSPSRMAQVLTQNREHLIPRLDAIVGEIQEIRALLASEEYKDVEAFLEGAVEDRRRWLNMRHKGTWEEPRVDVGEGRGRSLLGSLLGFGARRKRDPE